MSIEVPPANLNGHSTLLVRDERPIDLEVFETDADEQRLSTVRVFAQCVAVVALATVGWSFLSLFGEPGEGGGRRFAVILGYAMVGVVCVVYGAGLMQSAEATEADESTEF